MTWRHVLTLLSLFVGCDTPATFEDPSVAITPLHLPLVQLQGAQYAVEFRDYEGPTVLHFWATWCAPCRHDLPGLLRLADEVEGVRVVAVTDEPLSTLRRYFAAGEVPRYVRRDSRRVLANALGVGSLPDTYIVDAGGVARRRVAGSLDWTSPAVRAWVESFAHRELR